MIVTRNEDEMIGSLCIRRRFGELRLESFLYRSFISFGRGGSYGSDDKFASYVAKPPQTKKEPAWHRLAKDIKNFDADNLTAAQVRHLGEIRKGYDPHDTIPKLEEEIQGEIAYALSKTGSKVTMLFRELHKLDEAIENAYGEEKAKLIDLFNEVRQMAYDARRDLIIHRQAVGTAPLSTNVCVYKMSLMHLR